MINFQKHSGVYSMTVKQELKSSLDKVWSYFSNPSNLSEITPTYMGFHITNNPDSMYAGQIITYKLSPFPGLKINWITEITHVDSPKYFIDQQRFGPYKMWHHEHHFEQVENNVIMTDKLFYKLPFGVLGRFANKLFIQRKIKQIFEYRYQILDNLFNA